MAFPSTVTLDATIAPGSQAYSGPIQVGTNLYLVPTDNTNWRVYKSSDGGTTWVQTGGAGPAGLDLTVYDVVLVGTTIWLVFCSTTHFTATRIKIGFAPYDTLTDTWGATTLSANTITNFPTFLQAAYRAFDNTLVVCRVIDSLVVPTVVQYFTFNVGTLVSTADVPCGGADGNNWDCPGIINAGAFTIFQFRHYDNAGTFVNLECQSLADNGTLGAVVVIDTAPHDVTTAAYFSCTDGTTVVLGWGFDITNFNPVVKTFSGAPADPMVFVEQDFNVVGVVSPTLETFGAERDAGVTRVFITGQIGFTDSGYIEDSGTGFGAYITLAPGVDYSQTGAGALIAPGTFAVQFFGNAGYQFWAGVGVVPPATSSGTIRLPPPLPSVLPDPRIHCANSAQKRCVVLDGRNIQMTKGVTGIYP